MNYFELYPGDYLRDTTRLTLVDHGAYLRLLMAYYAEEKPLPADVGELFVIVSAVSPADKAAVRKVADRFFPVGDDGLRRNSRADAEIVKAQKRIATARANGSKHGKKDNQETTHRVTQRVSQQDTQRVTRSGEALHTPHAISVGSTEASTQVTIGTEAGRACLLMRKAGCVNTNPGHVDLQAALSEGVSPEVLRDTVVEAVEKGIGKPFAWSISTARSRHAAGPSPVVAGQPRAGPRPVTEGKTMGALKTLEGMKSGNERERNRLDPGRILDGVPEAADARLGGPAGG